MTKRAGLVAALLACGLGLAACGGVDEDDETGVDAGTDTDTDTDTDSDSDGDGDADTDSDADTETETEAVVIDMDCTDCSAVGGTLENMLCAVDMCDATLVIENEYTALVAPTELALEDTYEAVTRFGDDVNDLAPAKNGSYALMATGYATGTAHSTQGSYEGTEDPWSVEETAEIYDAVEWRLALWAPPEALGFRFKYVFFSEEYDDFISYDYNDKLYIFLEANSTADGARTLINFTECRAPEDYWDFVCGDDDPGCVEGQKYCYIAINSAYSDCCWYAGCPDGLSADVGTDIAGTGFECAADLAGEDETTGSSTGWLQTSWPIEGGEMFVLTFHIHDTDDGALDSEVLIDALEFIKEPDQGTTPIDPI